VWSAEQIEEKKMDFFVTRFTNGEVEPCYKSSFLRRGYMWQFKLFCAVCLILIQGEAYVS